jgi:hypothetical protein
VAGRHVLDELPKPGIARRGQGGIGLAGQWMLARGHDIGDELFVGRNKLQVAIRQRSGVEELKRPARAGESEKHARYFMP